MNYLGNRTQENSIIPQKIQIRTSRLKTLSDFQRLLRDINWIQPLLNIPTYKLQHLFNTLQRPSDLNSPRDLTVKAEELKEVTQHIQKAQLLKINLHKPLLLLIYLYPHSKQSSYACTTFSCII